MSKTRTVEWASVAGWAAENEQQIRDVMKFEGLKGAMVEVLRLAPDQPELAALREDLLELEGECDTLEHANVTLKLSLADAERRNAELTDLIEKAHTWVDRNNCGGWDAYELRDRLADALKPTESGASDSDPRTVDALKDAGFLGSKC